ncbi:MAG: hypothetical protein H6667_16385 [Ardenticatenaceae bacterium]|nr:hypothetical protein [Ardenticatenaceae bacterium]
MPIFLIAVVAIIVIIVAGIVLAKGTAVFDRTVQQNRTEMEKASMSNGYNMALTMGYKIPVSADYEAQMQEARKLAAKQAAAAPRGANNGIGRLGEANELKTAWKGVDSDPVTAVKIAAFHGWDGLRTGFVVAPPAAAAPAASAAAAPAAEAEIELVPGKDYPIIEVTDDMSPADIRKARIANAKAKSAAMKAAKTAGTVTSAPAAAPAMAPAPVAVNVPEPELIEITDDMSPDEVRKARIANSKAQSAYKKALKAAGVDPSAAAAPAPAASAAAAPAPAAAPAAGAVNLPPKPELIEITDDMDPSAVRQARIANSKAVSAYKKALKAAGIDPSTAEI